MNHTIQGNEQAFEFQQLLLNDSQAACADFHKELEQLKRTQQASQQHAVKQSRATMRGQATEHLAPLLMGEFTPKDLRFVGNPIDYLVIDGLSSSLDGDTVEIRVALMDVKTGNSKLTKQERLIRDAIKAGRVSFITYNVDTQKIKEFTDVRSGYPGILVQALPPAGETDAEGDALQPLTAPAVQEISIEPS